jgi:hypothetical protein
LARYEHLPIYLAAVESMVYFEGIVRNFSRYNKYTLGSDLRNKSRQIACRIMRVNSLRDKREGLEELAADIEELKLLIRMCRETGAFFMCVFGYLLRWGVGVFLWFGCLVFWVGGGVRLVLSILFCCL